MAEVDIHRILTAVSSDKIRDRTEGLEDLKHILLQSKSNSGLDSLNDKAYHSIFEAIFRCISIEKSVYNRVGKPTATSTSASRLISCAAALRSTAEIGVSTLRQKTVIAVVHHITETLPKSGEGLWDLLSRDFLKALRTLLEYPPHLEHLSKDDWGLLIDFCFHGLGVAYDDDDDGPQLSIRNGRLLPSRSADEVRGRSNSVEPTLRSRSGVDNGRASGNTENLEICIELLTSSANAPLCDEVGGLLRRLNKYLSSMSSTYRPPHPVFSAFNTALEAAIKDNFDLAQSTMVTVIPVIRRFWPTKSVTLKEEMLITLMLGMPVLRKLGLPSPPESFVDTVQGLVDQLHREYRRQPKNEILQIDDLSFSFSSDPIPMGMRVLGPKLGAPRSEQNWALLSIISDLSKLLDRILLTSLDSATDGDVEGPKKKRHLLSRTSDFFREASSATGATKICALQLTPFLLHGNELGLEVISSLLEQLSSSILDDDGVVASWTMIAIASIAASDCASSEVLRPMWVQAWELASRNLPAPATTRTASFLMSTILHFELLDHLNAVDTTESLVSSVDLNGPSVLTDAALSMWSKMIPVRLKINPRQGQDTSKQLCIWLRNTWSLETLTDRLQTRQIATFARPLDLIRFFFTCTGRPLTFPVPSFSRPLGRISTAWFRHHQDSELIDFLFLINNSKGSGESPSVAAVTTPITFNIRHHPSDQTILDLLQTKVDSFSQIWESLSSDMRQHVTPDVTQILTSLCVVTHAFLESLPTPLSFRCQSLRTNTEKLWSNVCSFLVKQDGGLLHACLEILSPLVLSLQAPFDDDNVILKAMRRIAPQFVSVLEHYRSNRTDMDDPINDMMQVDDHFSSQESRSSTTEATLRYNREDISVPVPGDYDSLRIATTVQLFAIYILGEPHDNEDTLTGMLTTLDDAEILACRRCLSGLFSIRKNTTRSDACNLLMYFGEKCMGSYSLERCEAALSICVELMTSYADLWTTGETDDLFESVADLYDWFITVLAGKGRGSPRVLIKIAALLEVVIGAEPAFVKHDSQPSPRTCLFKILRDGDLTVKFHVSRILPTIFGRFVLKEHDSIFDDILDSIPRDRDWTEGIAMRLYILSKLASKWHTLLRRSIYHIFETPGQVPESAPYAKVCLLGVSKSLGLNDPKDIFRLFASQVLYTWIETESLESIPFSVFGYSSINEIITDVQDEIVGQIIMRSKEDAMSSISKHLNAPFPELLVSSFYKAEAYSLARDISIPPSQDSQPNGAESQMKKILGTERYVRSMERSFPEITATLFRCVDQPEQIERAFQRFEKRQKGQSFRYALEIWYDINERSASTVALPANQQPSFRAKYLLDELEFLCERTGYELDTMWTPALVSFVSRNLLDSINPALGSLHACSVLRKLKILVCVAGPLVLQDYPLEMLLHSLRPFLTDFHCSEDAIGLFWYLIDRGKDHLFENPSFMTGLSVSTLASLRSLLSSSQESTTQETHFRSTLSKAQAFHDWFTTFLDGYNPPKISKESNVAFRAIVNSSKNVKRTGNASIGTYESELLMNILQRQSPELGLLSDSARELVFSLLCEDFQRPSNFRDDILGDDEAAMENAVALWNSLQNQARGAEYRLWVARALGRGFAASGRIIEQLRREQQSTLIENAVEGSGSSSKVATIRALCDSLLSNNRQVVSLAERTLQLIVKGTASVPEYNECEAAIPTSLMKALVWTPYQCPDLSLTSAEAAQFSQGVRWAPDIPAVEWARNVAIWLALKASHDPVVGALPRILYEIPSLAAQLLPCVLHDALLSEIEQHQVVRQEISTLFQQVFREAGETTLPHVRLVIDCVLYLRHQPLPRETTMKERDNWLEIDYADAALAAAKCKLYKTSLLFIEIRCSRVSTSSRRSSAAKSPESLDILHDIFKNIDDPDLFYGIQQDPSLAAVMNRLEHEGSGFKYLSFQGANYDIDMKLSQARGDTNSLGVLKALNSTNLQGIASVMFAAPSSSSEKHPEAFESMLSTALDLQQWDIPAPPMSLSPAGSLFKVMQSLSTSDDSFQSLRTLDECFLGVLDNISGDKSLVSLRALMRTLGILTEVDEALSSQSAEQILEAWERMVSRSSWLKLESFQDITQILSSHEALFSLINDRNHLKARLNLSSRDAKLLEVKVVRESLRISRDHDVHQASLKSAISLSRMVQSCAEMGLDIEAASTFDLANVLWDQGEMATSIQMLHQLNEQDDMHKQSIPVSRAEVLASLGHHVAEARLRKPDEIIQEYLIPAITELAGSTDGAEAGRVYHEFASFCDKQLQNADGLEDFRRIEQLRYRKEREVQDLENMMRSSIGKEKDQLRVHRTKALQWFELDDREYQRLKQSRARFLEQCLENYLLSLKACDTFGNDVLRFCALWLDNSESELANEAVGKYISTVPSRKFASLMNQLSSRLLDVEDSFQPLLSALVFRICVDHPYHGMYQIFTNSKSRGGKDQMAIARYQAANKLVERLRNDRRAGSTWVSVHNMNITFVKFAMDKLDDKQKSGSKVLLRKSITGKRLEQDGLRGEIPPPTMKIELRADCDYSRVPKLVKYLPEFTVASGISAPKIVTAIASDGLRYKQLFKGGNDDLRQDSIMEQVFEQVSNLLRDHRATQQRKLGIRTYKVLPLTANTGIIEFVPNTIPLHDYLMPAHQKHFPRDMKPNSCRKHISDVQTKSVEQRVKVFRHVTDHFHPVMRFFFMERFKNPDDWFSTRQAYTRSTAAISILGHVLGLGDRHGHNILLDEKTGEVVHIDLGVAFEQGRVLPIPELVPFRLTRDLVDGFGITKTEGSFRRCCEFTLEALREESYSIMTILDVLRYDPLYSWSLSPLRVKKMQNTQEAAGGTTLSGETGKSKNIDEPSEADRALTVVAKKLGKTLSVAATVNELIQQATDERHLAVLYCGWAAYA